MTTKIFNLIFAGLGTLIFTSELVKDSGNREWVSLLLTLVNLCWLLGAIGLFFRSRVAWCGSLVGVGVMLSGSVTMFLVGLKLVPIAQDPTDGIGYAIIIGFFGVLLSAPLLVGLVRLRRKWLFPATTTPNESLQATAAPKG